MARRQLPDGSWIDVQISYPADQQPSDEDKKLDEQITLKGATGEELSDEETARLNQRKASYEAEQEKQQAGKELGERQASSEKAKEEQDRRRGSQQGTVLTSPLGVTTPPTVKKKKLLGV